MPTPKVSPHFSLDEFRCKGKDCCGNQAVIDPALLQGLEMLRDRCGNLPLTITSAYRCFQHNREVHSDDESQHPLGNAADVVPPQGMTPTQLAEKATEVKYFQEGGIGIYREKNFVHLDVRGTSARWGNW